MRLEMFAKITSTMVITAILLGSACTETLAGVTLRPLTVSDAIETARFLSPAMTSRDKDFNAQPVFLSPDSTTYIALTLRGDVAENGLWLEMFHGSLKSVEAAARPQAIAKLFTSGLGEGADGNGLNSLTLPGAARAFQWRDQERFAFIWNLPKGETAQVAQIDVRTHRIEYLTNHPTHVTSYAFGPNNMLLYTARMQRPTARLREIARRGFAVQNRDGLSLIAGDLDGTGVRDRLLNNELFIQSSGKPAPQRVVLRQPAHLAGKPLPLLGTPDVAARFSPDGRHVLIAVSPLEIPLEWDDYVVGLGALSIREQRAVTLPSDLPRQFKQFFLVQLDNAGAKPLVDMPNAPEAKAVWAPDSASILIGPTFIPGVKPAKGARNMKAFFEIEIATGLIRGIPLPGEYDPLAIEEFTWHGAQELKARSRDTDLIFKKSADAWKLADIRRVIRPSTQPHVTMELRQDLNTAPVLIARERSSRHGRIAIDPNPHLSSTYSLGKVELIEWYDAGNRRWTGLLYRPVQWHPERRYPLVIQTHGHVPPTEFSLYGRAPGLGPGYSVYAAQPLANRNIAVLQVQDKREPGIYNSGPVEAQMYMGAYEAAIEMLVRTGLVDRSKVGLVGFSRTGWHVQYALSHSSFPYAAAVSSDGTDASYVVGTLVPGYNYDENGIAPFGEDLKKWLTIAPGFLVERINTPLRLQWESSLPTALFAWEMFSRLRALNRPVELHILPQIDRGAHNVQNPAQCAAVQQGAVDWFDFWLNGYEDPDPVKAEQYVRWRRLRGSASVLSRESSLDRLPLQNKNAEIRMKQAIGRILVAEDGSRFVYEWLRPYAWDGNDRLSLITNGMQTLLYKVDVELMPESSSYIVNPRSGYSYQLGALSADGRQVRFIELNGEDLRVGTAELNKDYANVTWGGASVALTQVEAAEDFGPDARLIAQSPNGQLQVYVKSNAYVLSLSYRKAGSAPVILFENRRHAN